ncbi:hypothetical protein AgCh_031247 [Apium graveolens]
MTVAEYEAKFTELSRFVHEFVNTEEKKTRRFQLGLKQWIQNRVAVLELTDYATLVQKASIIEAGREFDVILGMDWLSSNRAQIDCEWKRAKRLLKKGNEAYLAYVVDTKKEVPNIQDIPTVNKFKDVFSENLPGLPPDREIEFAIELAQGTTPVSKAPYRLAPVEMKELDSQLQELLDNGMIRPSVSSWGAPILFVKKKDGIKKEYETHQDSCGNEAGQASGSSHTQGVDLNPGRKL